MKKWKRCMAVLLMTGIFLMPAGIPVSGSSMSPVSGETKAAASRIAVKQILTYEQNGSGRSFLNYTSPVSGKTLRVSLHRVKTNAGDRISYCLNRTRKSDFNRYNDHYHLEQNKNTAYSKMQRNILEAGYPSYSVKELNRTYGGLGVKIPDNADGARAAEQATQLAIWISNYSISQNITLSEAYKRHAPKDSVKDGKGGTAAELCKEILARADHLTKQSLLVKTSVVSQNKDQIHLLAEVHTKAQYFGVSGALYGIPAGARISSGAQGVTISGHRFTVDETRHDAVTNLHITFPAKERFSGTLRADVRGSGQIPPEYEGILFYKNTDPEYQDVLYAPGRIVPPAVTKTSEISWKVKLPSVIKILKTSTTGKKEGFRFRITGENGSSREAVTDREGMILYQTEIDHPVTFTIEEIPTDPMWILPDAQKITLNPGVSAEASFLNIQKKMTIMIEKQDRETGKLPQGDAVFEGAEYRIMDAAGKTVETVVIGKNGTGSSGLLDCGVYTVKEVKAPKGYELDPEIHTVKGDCGTQNVKVKDHKITSLETVRKGSFHLIKKREGNGMLLPGCEITLYDRRGKKIRTEKTDAKGEIHMRDLPYGSYTWKETKAPEGYVKDPGEYQIMIDTDGKVIEKELFNSPTEIRVIKTDHYGNRIPDVVFELFDASKSTLLGVYKTDAEGVIIIHGLSEGRYFLRETSAPPDYQMDPEWKEICLTGKTPEEIRKEIPELGKNAWIGTNAEIEVVNRSLKTWTVILEKSDETGKRKLQGAEYSLYRQEQDELVRSGLKTDQEGILKTEIGTPGNYYFLETKAPTGYELNRKPIHFSVDPGHSDRIQILKAADPAEQRKAVVIKKIPVKDINFANGNPIFIFRMYGTDLHGEDHTYYQMVEFDEAYVKTHMDPEGFVSQKAEFTGFPAGHYRAAEEETGRYALEDISGIISGKREGNEAVWDLVSSRYAEAVFFNKNYEQQNYSDTSVTVNKFPAGRKPVDLIVRRRGDDRVGPGTVIRKEDLDVRVLYDNGDMLLVPASGYVLSDQVFPEKEGYYTFSVSYTEKGITRRDAFSVQVKKQSQN